MKLRVKYIFLIILLLIGISLIVFGFINDFQSNDNLFGLMLGLGSGLIGASLSQIYTLKLYKNNPKLMQQKTIEVLDERNVMIKNTAKGRVFDIYNIVFPLIIFLFMVMNVKFIITGILLLLYVSRIILVILYIKKYDNIM